MGQNLIDFALQEDLPSGDITTDPLIPIADQGRARLIAKQDLILSGQKIFEAVYLRLPGNQSIQWHFNDSDKILDQQTVATLQSQVTVQAQYIAQLRQVIAVNTSGAVTIQAPNILNISAGSTVNMAASLVDVRAGLTGVHGTFKADTLISTNVISASYSPGAGNIW